MRKLVVFLSIMVLLFIQPLSASAIEVSITGINKQAYPTISLAVDITDNNGKPIYIPENEFKILENNNDVNFQIIDKKAQQNKNFVPIWVTFIIDTSYSMSENSKLITAKEAVCRFLDILNNNMGHQGRLITFNTSINIGEFTPDFNKLKEDVNSLQPAGDTRFYDTLVKVLSEYKAKEDIRSIFVLLSDGTDTASQTNTFTNVLTVLKQVSVQMFSIELENGGNKTELEQLATESNGGKFIQASTTNLSDIFGAIGERVNKNLIINYETKNRLADGLTRTVEVLVKGVKATGYYKVPGILGEPPKQPQTEQTSHTTAVIVFWFILLTGCTILCKLKGLI